MKNVLALQGPVLKVNGELILVVPLAGGCDLTAMTPGIREAREDFLKIVIPEWLAGILEIEEGDVIRVGGDGIHMRAPNPRRVH